MKDHFLFLFGFMGSFLTALFGEFTYMLALLLFACVLDLASGLIVAGVFKTSAKTSSGGLSSNTMSKGISKKIMIISLVALGHLLDLALGVNIIMQGIMVTFILNEILSITENMALMGLKIPSVLTKALDILEKKGE